MKPNEPEDLLVEYWKSFLGPRKFEILVNGVAVATENALGLQTMIYLNSSGASSAR